MSIVARRRLATNGTKEKPPVKAWLSLVACYIAYSGVCESSRRAICHQRNSSGGCISGRGTFFATHSCTTASNSKRVVVLIDGSKSEGDLIEVTETDIIIKHTEGKGKKLVIQDLVIPFNNIKTTTVQIKF